MLQVISLAFNQGYSLAPGAEVTRAELTGGSDWAGTAAGRTPARAESRRCQDFVGGLSPASSARSLPLSPMVRCSSPTGHIAETKEYMGGFWVLAERALAWGRKAVVACRAPLEVRPIL
jgi:hypothetical protein